MKFTLTEWNTIKHALKVARGEYEKIRNDSKVSDKETSFYQIFQHQIDEVNEIIKKIETTEV